MAARRAHDAASHGPAPGNGVPGAGYTSGSRSGATPADIGPAEDEPPAGADAIDGNDASDASAAPDLLPATRDTEATAATDAGPRRLAIGIDFGGSGIKGAAVDLETGQLRTERFRLKTPQPSTPANCTPVIAEIVAQITAAVELDLAAPVGIGIPAVVIDGIVLTAANIDDEWLGYEAGDALTKTLGRRTVLINDADAAGLAEMTFGAGRGRQGTVLLVTLGTGVGSALFRNGELVPNTELGHIEVRGRDAEERASSAARTRRGLSWRKWADEVDEFLHRVDMLVWPDLIIVGGGVSKDADRFVPEFTVRPPVVGAALRNEAGIVGAALVAAGARSEPRPGVAGRLQDPLSPRLPLSD